MVYLMVNSAMGLYEEGYARAFFDYIDMIVMLPGTTVCIQDTVQVF